MNTRQYYAYVSGEVEGPYDRNQIEELYKSEKIDLQTQVREDGGKEWITYADLKVSMPDNGTATGANKTKGKPSYAPLAAMFKGSKPSESVTDGATLVDIDIPLLKLAGFLLRLFLASMLVSVVVVPVIWLVLKILAG